MISKRIEHLRNRFNRFNIDGYIIPKNDEFFSEYAAINRLRIISNFSGSAGLAIVLRKNNYLFIDGRYTIQAQQESGEQFKIILLIIFFIKETIFFYIFFRQFFYKP